jgi:hypothetical protein
MYPQNPSEVITKTSVVPGDAVTASVTYNPPVVTVITSHGHKRTTQTAASYSLTLTDNTTGSSYTTTQASRFVAGRSSAEVITEAPWSGGTLPLANFGTADYSASQVNSSPLGSAPGLQAITMDDPYGMVATPSALDTTGQLFNVSWTAPGSV